MTGLNPDFVPGWSTTLLMTEYLNNCWMDGHEIGPWFQDDVSLTLMIPFPADILFVCLFVFVDDL